LPSLHEEQKKAIRELMAKMDTHAPARLSGAVSV
jgi:hypothetical protein